MLMQHKKRFAFKLIGILLISQLGLSFVSAIDSNMIDNEKTAQVRTLGSPGTELVDANSVYECTDPALTFIGCDWWIDVWKTKNVQYPGSIVVMDDGLTVNQWKTLEKARTNGYFVDIVKYVTLDDNGNVRFFGSKGVDDLTSVTDYDLGGRGMLVTHTYDVISSLMTIAREVDVIVIDIAVPTNQTSNDDGGFDVLDERAWDWIIDNMDGYGIKVINFSLKTPYLSYNARFINRKITTLYLNNVYIAAGIGNSGDQNQNFPIVNDYVRAIGSIDHEDRGGWAKDAGITYWDPKYYSSNGSYSGGSSYGILYCPNTNTLTLCSSYGSDLDPNKGISFVMPGNGIPLPSLNGVENHSINQFVYGIGTSYSTPYFSATVMIAEYAYTAGWKSVSPSTQVKTLTVDEIDDLFRQISSRDTWDYRLGWGFLNIQQVYQLFYEQGVNDAPFVPGGGGGSIFFTR